MTDGPRLSLKAIAEQAVRAKNEAQNENKVETAQRTLDVTPAAQPRLPSPPQLPRFEKHQLRQPPNTNLMLPAALIALLSAALAGGVVWWLTQSTTRQAPVAEGAPSPAPAIPNATASGTAPVAPAALPAAASTELIPSGSAEGFPVVPPVNNGSAKQQPAKSTEDSSAEIAKAKADPTGGPLPAGSAPPAVSPPPGVRGPRETPQESEPTNLTPSSGAVQAAIGSVLGNARTCVAGDREASRARVVFNNTGAVSAVTVTGPAAGTPAESCIKTALSKARVAPFQKPNYSVDTTIRP